MSPNGGASYGATDEVFIRWSSADPDGELLRHTLYYSPDGDQQWIVVATEVAGTEFLWRLADVPGTPTGQGRIRVVASDGFNSAQDESGSAFQVEGKPPLVAILHPRPRHSFLQCKRLPLRGAAIDPENRLTLTVWSVDGKPVSSNLVTQLPPLPPGPHEIVLTAIDEQGLVGSGEIQVVVKPDSDCDGMSDGFEEDYGLEPGFAEDAAFDDDEDGLINFEEAYYVTHPKMPDTDQDGYSDGEEVRWRSNPADPSSAPNPPFQNPLYLNCGGTVEIVDPRGRLWRPDAPWLTPGHAPTQTFTATGRVDTSLLNETNVPNEILLTQRWRDGNISYKIPAPNGPYRVTLYFSENYLPAVNPNLGGTGSWDCARIFDVEVEGQIVAGFNPADAAILASPRRHGGHHQGQRVDF